jgi:hypothetical protein
MRSVKRLAKMACAKLAKPFAAPVVDGLRMPVAADFTYDRFIAEATHPIVKIEIGRG